MAPSCGYIDAIWPDAFGGADRTMNIIYLPPECSPALMEKFWLELARAVARVIDVALDSIEDGRTDE
jgi:hypothetical protein